MTKGPQRLVVSNKGAVRVEGENLESWLRSQAGDYAPISDTPGLLILRRLLPEGEDSLPCGQVGFTAPYEPDQGPKTRVILAGEVLVPLTLFQIVEVIANRNWDGDLRIVSRSRAVFQLRFEQGALRCARSNDEQDRLGQTLVRAGIVTQEQLQEVLDAVPPERRLGDELVEREFLTKEELFEYLGKQVKGIFFHALAVEDGSYVFTTPQPFQDPPPYTVHLRVRRLLMEGVQRIDEMEIFRETIPSSEVTFRRRNDRTEGLDADCLAVLAYCNGRYTLARIAELTKLDEFSATKAAYHLVKRKRVELIPPINADPEELHRLVEGLDAISQHIFETMRQHGEISLLHAALSAWIRSNDYADLFGELSENGGLDLSRVVQAVRDADFENPMEALSQMGHELVSFALFTSGSMLPRATEKQLAIEVDQRTRSLRMH